MSVNKFFDIWATGPPQSRLFRDGLGRLLPEPCRCFKAVFLFGAVPFAIDDVEDVVAVKGLEFDQEIGHELHFRAMGFNDLDGLFIGLIEKFAHFASMNFAVSSE